MPLAEPTKDDRDREEKARPLDEPNGRTRLITVAMRLFAERGYDGVTVRDIAGSAGVSVGLINHHFQTKEGLREAVDNRFLRQFEEAVRDPRVAPGGTTKASLAEVGEWAELWIERHIDDWDLTRAYMRRALLENSDWGSSLFSRFLQVVRATVDRLDAAGRLRPDVDRLWLPLLIAYMELGTLLLEPHVDRVLGRSAFDRDLWRRRHRAYMDLIYSGTSP